MTTARMGKFPGMSNTGQAVQLSDGLKVLEAVGPLEETA